jgi:hypothetical protein
MCGCCWWFVPPIRAGLYVFIYIRSGIHVKLCLLRVSWLSYDPIRHISMHFKWHISCTYEYNRRCWWWNKMCCCIIYNLFLVLGDELPAPFCWFSSPTLLIVLFGCIMDDIDHFCLCKSIKKWLNNYMLCGCYWWFVQDFICFYHIYEAVYMLKHALRGVVWLN